MQNDWPEFQHKIMKRAITLAKRGRVWVHPNPMVGAVVVKNGEIVGEGYHKKYGGPHAEVHALDDAGEAAIGADLYVNLEPCCHYGKTPPCVEKIKKAGIRRVFAAIQDPNPIVQGKGFKVLEEAGIEVSVGLLEDEANELNCAYLKKASTGKTWVTLKIAQTVDGRIAAITGHSRWITSKKSRTYAHMMRATHDAVLVGAGTVIADDPMLNVRHVRGRNPVRIVLDTNLSISPDSKIINTPNAAATWVFCAPKNQQLPSWAGKENVDIIILPRNSEGKVDLAEMLDRISRRGIMSLMVEGGSLVWTAFLAEGLVDKIEVMIAPIIIGHGINAIQDLGVLKVPDAVKLGPMHWRRMGPDLHIAARVIEQIPQDDRRRC